MVNVEVWCVLVCCIYSGCGVGVGFEARMRAPRKRVARGRGRRIARRGRRHTIRDKTFVRQQMGDSMPKSTLLIYGPQHIRFLK